MTRIENSPDGGGAIARGILDMGNGFGREEKVLIMPSATFLLISMNNR